MIIDEPKFFIFAYDGPDREPVGYASIIQLAQAMFRTAIEADPKRPLYLRGKEDTVIQKHAGSQLRVLVCGGRNFDNTAFIWSRLDGLHAETPIYSMIHGGASGADKIANEWAKSKGIRRYVCRAEWGKYGRSAGPKRNARMLEWRPDVVVAFPGDTGTANMVSQARAAGVRVIEIT